MLGQDNRLHLVADLHVEATQIDEELVDDELLEMLDFEDRRAVEILWSEEIQNAVVGLHALEGSVRTEEIKIVQMRKKVSRHATSRLTLSQHSRATAKSNPADSVSSARCRLPFPQPLPVSPPLAAVGRMLDGEATLSGTDPAPVCTPSTESSRRICGNVKCEHMDGAFLCISSTTLTKSI